MEYPRFVYTAPGPNQCQGGTYGQELVKNEAEHAAALEAGFKDGIPDALRAYRESQTPKVKPETKKVSEPNASQAPVADAAAPNNPATAGKSDDGKKDHIPNAPKAAVKSVVKSK